MKVKRGVPKKPRIEMLPLIDIVFLLLVFFIYGMFSMAVHHSLPVKLPLSTTAKLDRAEFVSITVKSDGSIYVNKTPVRLSSLVTILKDRLVSEKIRGALIFADRTVSYQSLFRVLDKIREAGIDRISLQAELERN